MSCSPGCLGQGVTVRQPDVINHSARVRTLSWFSGGFCIACPRDGYLVIADEIIETPMCWRSRYFEGDAYRSLFKEYFRAGVRWSSAAWEPGTLLLILSFGARPFSG
ncbi:hypothetical protein MCP1_100016 [Candidatus Terasakiella magnetica]|nr:hypothetical protein MCP1_100016 [Candidatus Terasakiella magnetica]